MILLLIFVVLVIIVLLILPESIAKKITMILGALSVFFIAYSLWRNVKLEQKELVTAEIQRNNQYWTDITSSFLEGDLSRDFSLLYGNELTPEQFVLYTRIAQAIENINMTYGYSENMDTREPWLIIIRNWVSSPLFQVYWRQYSSFYSVRTQTLINSLISG